MEEGRGEMEETKGPKHKAQDTRYKPKGAAVCLNSLCYAIYHFRFTIYGFLKLNRFYNEVDANLLYYI
jgi:hypothetical protein